jgi:hypothetical protein
MIFAGSTSMKFVRILLGVVGLSLVALLTLPRLLLPSPPVRGPWHSLKTVASAQADYRGNDRDENGQREFWRADISGLYSVVPKGSREMIKLIEISVAGADDSPQGTLAPEQNGPGHVAQEHFARRAPKAGYFYRALRHADEDPKKLDPTRFAACAYPAEYPMSGRKTFIIREDNTIYARDLGRPGPPDVYPDPATREREWAKLD